MANSVIPQLTAQFDELSHRLPDERIEFWFARDLMGPLGYARWENFTTAIKRAIESCRSTGYDEANHFRGVTKMVRRSEEHTSELQSLMRISYAVFCLKNNKISITQMNIPH